MAFLLYRALRGEQRDAIDPSEKTGEEQLSQWEQLCWRACKDGDTDRPAGDAVRDIVDWYRDFEVLRSQTPTTVAEWLHGLTLKASETSPHPEGEQMAARLYSARIASRHMLGRLPTLISRLVPDVTLGENAMSTTSPFSQRARVLRFVENDLQPLLHILIRDLLGFILVTHAQWMNTDLQAIRMYTGVDESAESLTDPSSLHLLLSFLKRPPPYVSPEMLTVAALKQSLIEERENLKMSLTECLEVVCGLQTNFCDGAQGMSAEDAMCGFEFVKCLEDASLKGSLLLDLLQHGEIESVLDLFAPIHDALTLLIRLADSEWCDREVEHRLSRLRSQLLLRDESGRDRVSERRKGETGLMSLLDESKTAVNQLMSFYRLLEGTVDVDPRGRAMISTLKEDCILLFLNCIVRGSRLLREKLATEKLFDILVKLLETDCDASRASILASHKNPHKLTHTTASTSVLNRHVIHTLTYMAVSPERNQMAYLNQRLSQLFSAWLVNEGERFYLIELKSGGETSPVCDDFWIEKNTAPATESQFQGLQEWSLLMRSMIAGDETRDMSLFAASILMCLYLDGSSDVQTSHPISDLLSMEICALTLTSVEVAELNKPLTDMLNQRDAHLISLLRPDFQKSLNLSSLDIVVSVALSQRPMLKALKMSCLLNDPLRNHIAGRILQPDIETIEDNGDLLSSAWPLRCVSCLRERSGQSLFFNVIELLKALVLPGTPIQSELRAALVQVRIVGDNERSGSGPKSLLDLLIDVTVSELSKPTPDPSRLMSVLSLFQCWMAAMRKIDPLDRSDSIAHQQNIQEARRARRAPVAVWENFHFDKTLLLNPSGIRMTEMIAELVAKRDPQELDSLIGMSAYFFIGLLGRALQLTEFLEICPVSEIYEVFTSSEMVSLASSVSRLHICVSSNEMSRILAAAGDHQRSLSRHNRPMSCETSVLPSEWASGGKLYEQLMSHLLWTVEGIPLSSRSSRRGAMVLSIGVEWSVLTAMTCGAGDRVMTTCLSHRVVAYKLLVQAVAFAASARPVEMSDHQSPPLNFELASAIEKLQHQVASLCARFDQPQTSTINTQHIQPKNEIANTPNEELVAIVGYLVTRVAELEEEVALLRRAGGSKYEVGPMKGQALPESDMSPFETPAVVASRLSLSAVADAGDDTARSDGTDLEDQRGINEELSEPPMPMEEETLLTDPFSSADPLQDLPRLSDLPSLMPDSILEQAHPYHFHTPDTDQLTHPPQPPAYTLDAFQAPAVPLPPAFPLDAMDPPPAFTISEGHQAAGISQHETQHMIGETYRQRAEDRAPLITQNGEGLCMPQLLEMNAPFSFYTLDPPPPPIDGYTLPEGFSLEEDQHGLVDDLEEGLASGTNDVGYIPGPGGASKGESQEIVQTYNTSQLIESGGRVNFGEYAQDKHDPSPRSFAMRQDQDNSQLFIKKLDSSADGLVTAGCESGDVMASWSPLGSEVEALLRDKPPSVDGLGLEQQVLWERFLQS